MAKKLPQPVRHKVLFQARYKPTLGFYNLLYTAAAQFSNYEHWETNGLHVLLYDYEKRHTLGIHHNNFFYDWDYGGTELFLDNIREATKQLPSVLQLSGFMRVGLRQQFLIPAQMDLKEVTDILNVKFLAQNEELAELFPNRLRDMSYIAISTEDNLDIRLGLGPMQKVEVPNHIQIDQKHHFSPDQPEDYAAVFNSYPNVAVFIDIDISSSGQSITPEKALSSIDEIESKLNEKVMFLQDYIFDRQVKL